MDAATDNSPSPKAGCAGCSESFSGCLAEAVENGRETLRNELWGAGVAHCCVSPWFLMAQGYSFPQSCGSGTLACRAPCYQLEKTHGNIYGVEL